MLWGLFSTALDKCRLWFYVNLSFGRIMNWKNILNIIYNKNFWASLTAILSFFNEWINKTGDFVFRDFVNQNWAISGVVAIWVFLVTYGLCFAVYIPKAFKLWIEKKEFDKDFKKIEKQGEEDRKTKELQAEEDSNLEDKKYELEKQKQEDLIINARVSEILPRFLNGEKLNPREVEFANFHSPLLSNLIATQYNLSGEAEDVIIEILKELKPNRVKVNALFNKLIEEMKLGRVCSLQLVQFLNSITDGDLEVIKEQFRYVNLLGICYSPIAQEKLVKNFNLEFPQIWSNLHLSGDVLKTNVIAYNISPSRTVNFTFKSKFCIYIMNTDKKEVIVIPYICTLSNIGLELYDILEDEIPETPLDYIEDFAEHINKNRSPLKAKVIHTENNPLSQK
jgi:hypothetical protein